MPLHHINVQVADLDSDFDDDDAGFDDYLDPFNHDDNDPAHESPARHVEPVRDPDETSRVLNLRSLIVDPVARGWQDYANCLGVDADLFFPERGASTREAKEVCRSCVVREECLEYALQNSEKFGIWGGMSERERRKLRRQRSAAAAEKQVSASA